MANPTLYELRQAIARRLGKGLDAEMYLGIATGGHNATNCQMSALDQFENDFFIDYWLRGYLGTHKDLTRTVTDSAKTNGVITWSPTFSAATDATDYFELHKDFSPEEFNDAINQAIRKIEDEMLTEKVDESLVVNDLLSNGLFETWTAGAAVVPTSWSDGSSVAPAFARESTIKREGSYSCKITNAEGEAAVMYQDISNYPLYAGVTNVKASLYARIACATASRVRLALNDGVTTTYSDYHDGTWWRDGAAEPWIKIENFAVSGSATRFRVQVRIEAGTAISAYVDKAWLVCSLPIYEYTIPSGFYTISDIYQEQSVLNQFSPRWDRISAEYGWKVLLNGSTKKLWFDPNVVHLTSGRKLRLEGQSKAATLSLDADTTPVRAAYLVPAAVAVMTQGNKDKERIYEAALREAEQERASLFRHLRGQIVDA